MRSVFAIMRIVFCDDDTEILNQLQKFVCEFFNSMNCKIPDYAVYKSGDELLENESMWI